MKQILTEFLTGIEGPAAPANRLRVAAWVRMLAVIPVIMGPTLVRMLQAPADSHDPEFLQSMIHGWMALSALYIVVNLLILALPTDRQKSLRALTYLCIALELGTNQISLALVGNLVSHAVLFVVLVVAIYRVLADYRLAFFAAALGAGMYATVGILELAGVFPLTTAFGYAVQHPYYDRTEYGVMAIAMVVTGIALTFVTINFGVNQSVKLHRYITDSILRRYLPPSMARQAAEGELRFDAPPERRVVTVVFADLVDFTPMSERLGAQAVGNLVNRYLTLVAKLAHEHEATVDKFIGDAVMIVVGAPDSVPPKEQVRRAVDLSWAIQHALNDMGGREFLRARIGINTGEVVMGNFGSPVRSDFTVLGMPVNIAARLEGACQPGRVLVGPETAKLLGDDTHMDPTGPLKLKGVKKPVEAWYVPHP